MIRILLLLATIASLFPLTVSAAEPADSLAGRKVHVYLPYPESDSLAVMNWNIRMRRDGRFWYTATLLGGRFESNQGFYFATSGMRMKLGKTGLKATEDVGGRFYLADFQGRQEIWIVVDPSASIGAPPVVLLEPPRVVNVLNPWTSTDPRLVFSGGNKAMLASDERCGWYYAFLLKPAEMRAHFQELNGTDTYGQGGLGSTADIDLAPIFTAKATPDSLGLHLWLDTETNTWFGSYPNKEGACQYMLATTVRDFSSAHPDFDFGNITGDHVVPGVVQTNIGANRKPVVNPANITRDPAISFSQFDKWWVTDSTNPTPTLRSYESCHDIPMSKAGDGSWEYDSYRDSPDHGFWPVEGALNRHNETFASCYVKPPPDSTSWVTGGLRRNGNFCMETHATFIYQPGQKSEFRSNDDLWVFINDKLVVDLGGVHVPKSASVNLDVLGLTPGQTYTWDLFHCQRQPCGSSLRIKTSIYFRQQRALEAVVDTARPGSFKLIKRVGGTGACGSLGDSVQVVPVSNLVYKLWNAAGTELETLGEGSWHQGGIVIATPSITVDTSKIDDLPPGNYRIVAFEPANQRIRAEIPFTILTGPTGIAKGRSPAYRPSAGSYHDILGRKRPETRDGAMRRLWRFLRE